MDNSPILSASVARAVALDWIDAWNCRDLRRILNHYAQDVCFASPRVAAAWARSGGVLGSEFGKLLGIGALKPYFQEALDKIPNLHLEIVKLLEGPGANSWALLYTRENGSTVCEVMRLGPDHKITHVEVFYDTVV